MEACGIENERREGDVKSLLDYMLIIRCWFLGLPFKALLSGQHQSELHMSKAVYLSVT